MPRAGERRHGVRVTDGKAYLGSRHLRLGRRVPSRDDPRDYAYEKPRGAVKLLKEAANPPLTSTAPLTATPTSKYWPDLTWRGDQGATPQCFPGDVPVLMGDGTEKPISGVSAGDWVVTHTGALRMVTAQYARRYEGNLAVLKLRGRRRPVRSTPEHPYLAAWFDGRKLEHRSSGWVGASSLVSKQPNEAGHYVHVPRWAGGTLRHPVTNVIDVVDYIEVEEYPDGTVRVPYARGRIPRYIELTEDVGWLVGLYFAEGYSKQRGGDFCLALARWEEDLAQRAVKVLGEAFGLEARIQRRPNNVIIVRTGSSTIARLFDTLCGRKAPNKRFHPSLWSWDLPVLQSVWDGWMEGDGHDDGKSVTGVTVSGQLARDFWRLGFMLGLAPTLRYSDVKARLRRWEVVSYRPRPTTRFPRDERFVYAAVESVTSESFEGLVYNLEVEEDHSYIADMAVVHNCVGYSAVHRIENSPRTYPATGPVVDPAEMYRLAQTFDEWAGESYDGSSCRGGARAALHLGYISEFRRIMTFTDLQAALMLEGSVVLGTFWHYDFFDPVWLKDARGTYRWTLRPGGGLAGGHAYLANGINIPNRVIRILNSWGPLWGDNGRAWMSFETAEQLIFAEDGEAFVYREV